MKKTVKKNVKKGREYVNILGINVISTLKTELLADIGDFVSHNTKFYITTPNPELVLASMGNRELKTALNNSDFPVPDGTGLTQAAKYLSLPIPDNILFKVVVGFCQGLWVGAAAFIKKEWLDGSLNLIKGRVLFTDLVELADKKNWKIFFLGGEGREAEIAANELRVKHPSLKLKTLAGPILNREGETIDAINRREEIEVIERINEFQPQLLFVAFGNPKQEIWIYKNLPKLKIGGAMAVGGTFRYVAGMSPLPPKWMDKTGLEWVWRLITEPYRAKRILNAFPIFPLRVFWFKISGR